MMTIIYNKLIINILIIFVTAYNTINDDLQRMNVELLELNKIIAHHEWECVAKNSSPRNFEVKNNILQFKSQWQLAWCDKFALYRVKKSSMEEKMICQLCRGPKYRSNETKIITMIFDRLVFNYENKKICINEGLTSERRCYRGENQVKRYYEGISDENELLWAWTVWRNEMIDSENLFYRAVALENFAARRNGYNDIGEVWREELGINNLEAYCDDLYRSIKPLYTLLHAVVRFKLQKVHPNALTGRTIPAHLLGDLWSQDWKSLVHLLIDNSHVQLNITEILINKNYTIIDMVKRSEDFYRSLGFPGMTRKFWKNSKFMENSNNSRRNYCHASAVNMYVNDDYRILACLDVNEDDFYVIHHEMGHVQYYMAYEKQPAIFRNGVNSAFHETIGDAIILGASAPAHLQRLGIINDKILKNHLPRLLKQALKILPQIPYALLMDKWRWRVFSGTIEVENINDYWWNLHKNLMGIEPGVTRSGTSFDAAAKFHIISNTPYIRYFFAHIFQFQLYEALCKLAVRGKIIDSSEFTFPLYKCDIYGSKVAGKRLRKIMSMGSSINTSQALRLIGITNYQVNALLKYFEPVQRYLEREIALNNITVGWT